MSNTPATVAIKGGVKVHVEYRDGTFEDVLVRELPVRLINDFMSLYTAGDEPKLVELMCNKPEGWADTILVESHEEIIDKGLEVNFPVFERSASRREKMVDRLNPFLDRSRALTQRLESLKPSPTSAPRPATGGSTPSS